MVFGFNTNVRIGDHSFHVQSEDRGPASGVLETLVFSRGRVVHRRTVPYDASLMPDELELRFRLEEQHRIVIEDVRTGRVQTDAPSKPPSGISLQLLNPGSWLTGGTATLQIEVRTRPEGAPLASADVEVTLNGQAGPVRFAAQTDSVGHATLSFPMPRLGPGGAELAIRAVSPAGEDELRYQLKPRPRPAPSAADSPVPGHFS